MDIQTLKPDICGCYLVMTKTVPQMLLSESPDGKYRTVLCDAHKDHALDAPFVDSVIHEEFKLVNFTKDAVSKITGVKPEDIEYSFDEDRKLKISLPEGSDIAVLQKVLVDDERIIDTNVTLQQKSAEIASNIVT